ncbi:uncharacterized protein BT62DRAFT_1081622 [Guyanagaster necrorhizus]|uniref:Uncharacterized protein n=1 Tax=Guyanagaster necrorhizus TaxID=856835 RepID=A0A9P7VG60_9AGAR|nr:uncharacterized protein BT62DRAFT_1081622 [Guyanagaster necrorhizus MCA 3950]KAG7439394.1 hypothetical protein BT62DRAFT_1081622 [Guyanagaster necrorhizus MCA 3950]
MLPYQSDERKKWLIVYQVSGTITTMPSCKRDVNAERNSIYHLRTLLYLRQRLSHLKRQVLKRGVEVSIAYVDCVTENGPLRNRVHILRTNEWASDTEDAREYNTPSSCGLQRDRLVTIFMAFELDWIKDCGSVLYHPRIFLRSSDGVWSSVMLWKLNTDE